MPAFISRRSAIALLAALALAPARSFASIKRRPKPRRVKEEKAWINGKGMWVFPFAADKLPDTADDFAAAMERGYRKALELPDFATGIVVARGGTYPSVDSLTIDVCDAVVKNPENKRKPSDRELALHGIDAAKFELLGKHMSLEHANVDLTMIATDARLLFTRDSAGKPLLVMGNAKAGHVSVELSLDDCERLLLAAAQKGGAKYALAVDKARLKMTVDDGRSVRVHVKLSTRVGFIPAGLHLRAKLDIDPNLDATLSELSCTGDEALGPLIGGLIQPFLDRYNGKTRPLMNFPKTDMRLRDVQITADETIRLAADFGS